MTEMRAALLEAHRKNLRRYCHLLVTNLTNLEREFIHRRIAETRLAMDRLEFGDVPTASLGGGDGLSLS